MNSEQLRQFMVIAETGSITRAAERLFLTQPTLSISLRRLEDEIGMPLFLRDGKRLMITESGRVLLKYARICCGAIDDAETYFRNTGTKDNSIRLYRIGGTSINLLTAGRHRLKDYNIVITLVRNKDLSTVIGTGTADIIISDDRYINAEASRMTEKVFLYHQELLLSVDKNNPLAKRDDIDVKELEHMQLLGRSNPVGFNDWLNDIKTDNKVDFDEEVKIDNMTYFAEREQLPWPYLMSSFGIQSENSRQYFNGRKNIRVTGNYTERDIYIFYNNQNKKDLKPVINLIKENVSKYL